MYLVTTLPYESVFGVLRASNIYSHTQTTLGAAALQIWEENQSGQIRAEI